MVEHQTGEAGEPLAEQGGKAGGDDQPHVGHLSGEIPEGELAFSLSGQEHIEQNKEAGRLGERRGDTGAGGAHMEHEDEDGIHDHVEDAAGDQTDHGLEGHALVAEDVVEHAAAGEQRPRQQNGDAIVSGIGENGVGAAEQVHEGREEKKSHRADDQPQGQREEEARGGIAGGAVGVVLSQAAGDVAAGAVAEHEAECLEDGHEAVDNADGARGALAQLADKVGVGHVVDVGDEHAGDGGDAQVQDELGNGRHGHLPELFFAGHGGALHGIISWRCGQQFIFYYTTPRQGVPGGKKDPRRRNLPFSFLEKSV